MLEIKDLQFSYGRKENVLNNINLILEPGQIGILLGKNGSGKTTLFKNILGICKPKSGEVTFDEFSKVQLRVVKVLEAEPVPETEKLLKLKVDLGTEQRELVSGIAKHYAPADLIGKNVVMVVNLKPAKIRGVVSHGMVLAASAGEDLKVLSVDMPVGAIVK